jgi:Holliday junction resolvase RusA-like endonuclease
MGRRWTQTIFGEPASKANSRKIATIGRGRFAKTRIIKSEKALGYAEDFLMQCRSARPPLRGRLRFTATIYYRTERPDLDESLLLDLLQGRVYENDRQVRERHVFHAIDKANPRAEILVEEVEEENHHPSRASLAS